MPFLPNFAPMIRLVIFVAISWFVAACAIQSAPDGGPKDEMPPEIVSCIPPNKSTNFTSNTIVIIFDEYVQLKNFPSNFFSSPPLTKRVEQKLKGKKLTLTLEEELLPNTTYTFSFGSALTDLTEGNVQRGFKYVFSTGPVLDSLQISGVAVDAYTGLPEKDALVMLYVPEIADSVLIKSKPMFYGVSDEEGHFAIENLAPKQFRLLVIADENLNLMFDTASEKVAFLLDDVASGTTLAQPLRLSFPPQKPNLLEAAQKGYGRVQLAFATPIKNPEVSMVSQADFEDVASTNSLVESNRGGDTLTYWFNPKAYPENIPFCFLNIISASFSKDSVRVLLPRSKPTNLNLQWQSRAKPSVLDSLWISSSTPLVWFDANRVSVHADTLAVPHTITQKTPRKILVEFEKEAGKTYSVVFEDSVAADLFGQHNDSLVLKTTLANEEEKAILYLNISATNPEPKIIEVLAGTHVIKRMPLTENITEKLTWLEPGAYGIRVFWDENENGIWDTGNAMQKKQPERVLYYPKAIELRANWELEVDWTLPE